MGDDAEGSAKKKQCLKFDIGKLIDDSGAYPPPEIIITKTSGADDRPRAQSTATTIEGLDRYSDKELDDRIKRLESQVVELGPILRDKGVKLKSNLRALKEEKEQRKQRIAEKAANPEIDPKAIDLTLSLRPSRVTPEAKVERSEFTTSLEGMFSTPVAEFVRRAVIDGVKEVVKGLLNLQSSQHLESSRAKIIKNLESLKIIAKVAEISDMSMSWIVSRVQKVFDSMDTLAKLDSEIDKTSLHQACVEMSACDTRLAFNVTSLNQVEERFLSIQEQELEVLKMEEELHKMKADIARDKAEAEKSVFEAKQCIQLDKAMKNDLEKAVKDGRAHLVELNLTKAQVQTIFSDLTAFISMD